MVFGRISPKINTNAKGSRTVKVQFEKVPKIPDTIFCTKMLQNTFNIKMVTKSFLGRESKIDTTLFRLSEDFLKVLTCMEERENKAVSDADKIAEHNKKMTRKIMDRATLIF